jgi:hypothetical protein
MTSIAAQFCEQLLQGRALEKGAGEGTIVITVGDQAPTFMRLTLYICLASLALGWTTADICHIQQRRGAARRRHQRSDPTMAGPVAPPGAKRSDFSLIGALSRPGTIQVLVEPRR